MEKKRETSHSPAAFRKETEREEEDIRASKGKDGGIAIRGFLISDLTMRSTSPNVNTLIDVGLGMKPEDVIKLLKNACAKAGGQKTWAAQVGISLPHVNDVLHSRRAPGQKICKALGIERVTTYRKARGNG